MRQNDSIDDETKIEQQRHLLFQKYLQLFNHEIYYTSIELETLEEIRGLEKSVWPPEIMLRFFGGSITYTTTARIHRNATDAFAFVNGQLSQQLCRMYESRMPDFTAPDRR